MRPPHSTPSTSSPRSATRRPRRQCSRPSSPSSTDVDATSDFHQRRNAMTARAVTEATFEQEVLMNDKAVLVDFWAEWCGPCRAVSPILDQIATENSDRLDIVKLNVDENPNLAMKYQITAIPAFKVFEKGEVVKTVIGAKPKPALEADLAAFIS
ncbi:thioredoxin [Agromyces bauzanensis]